MKQNEDFELIPGEDEWWNVRFLKGPFVETVIRMGNLVVDEKADNVKYDFQLISSPDNDLSEEEKDNKVDVIAISVIISALVAGAVVFISGVSIDL